MKKIVICIFLSLVLISILVTYLLGFRIVYNPQLSNSWDAIEATGTWIGVVSTLILTAIIIYQTQSNHKESQRIKKEIAEKEAKSTDVERRIELFEHRFKVYSLISSVHDQFYTHHYAKEEYYTYNSLFDDKGFLGLDQIKFLLSLLIPSNEYLQVITEIGKVDDLKEYQLIAAFLAETQKADFFFSSAISGEINEWAEKYRKLILRLLYMKSSFSNRQDASSNPIFWVMQINKNDIEDLLLHHKKMDESKTLERLKSIIEIPQNQVDCYENGLNE